MELPVHVLRVESDRLALHKGRDGLSDKSSARQSRRFPHFPTGFRFRGFLVFRGSLDALRTGKLHVSKLPFDILVALASEFAEVVLHHGEKVVDGTGLLDSRSLAVLCVPSDVPLGKGAEFRDAFSR